MHNNALTIASHSHAAEPSTRTDLLGQSLGQLEEAMQSLGEAPYRGRQLYRWIYRRGATDFESMTDLRLELRSLLAGRFTIDIPQPESIQHSPDGTDKLLFRKNKDLWESVLMRDGRRRRTVCVSSQSGCALGCVFCATARMGLRRNLMVGEIVGQVMATARLLPDDECVTNVVFMGMGEPLQNFKTVKAALDILTHDEGLAISHNRVTVSTVGLVPAMRKWAQEKVRAKMAISLIAPNDPLRSELMPINRRYPLAQLRDAAIAVAESTKRRVTFEYVLMDGINDSIEHAQQLVTFIHGIPCKINLIRFHPNPQSPYRRPPEERVLAFREYLYPRCPAVNIRKSFGVDIDAACGQLAGRVRVAG